jgi:hypothetical protein
MFRNVYSLIIICFLILNSCGEEPKLAFEETNFTTEKNTLVEIIIPVATGNPAIINTINSDLEKEVVKSLQIIDDETNDITSIEESITAFNEEYVNFKTNFPDVSQPWEAQIDGEIMYQSAEIISMSITSYINTGGAQGNLNISFLNYEAKTGTRIKNSALFKNIADFKALAQTYFEEAVEDKGSAFNPNSFELPENIGYNESGLILLFNAYETAPYASEIIEFVIPFEEVNSLLIFDSTR